MQGKRKKRPRRKPILPRAFSMGRAGKGLAARLRDGFRRCMILGQGFPVLQILPNRRCRLSGLRRRRFTATKAVARPPCPQVRASRKAKREKQHRDDATSLVFHRVPLLNARRSRISAGERLHLDTESRQEPVGHKRDSQAVIRSPESIYQQPLSNYPHRTELPLPHLRRLLDRLLEPRGQARHGKPSLGGGF
jgi:hypothetical protein